MRMPDCSLWDTSRQPLARNNRGVDRRYAVVARKNGDAASCSKVVAPNIDAVARGDGVVLRIDDAVFPEVAGGGSEHRHRCTEERVRPCERRRCSSERRWRSSGRRKRASAARQRRSQERARAVAAGGRDGAAAGSGHASRSRARAPALTSTPRPTPRPAAAPARWPPPADPEGTCTCAEYV
jgi:hypothetical protein